MVILASASPRRLALLAQIGCTPDQVIAADIDETPADRETPLVYVRRMAAAKLNAVHMDDAIVLAADTVVALGRRILPKAETEGDVVEALRLLSGRAHRVATAVALRRRDGRITERLVGARVQFKALSTREIDWYAASGEGVGKAGGYAIQGRAARFVRGLNGSYTAVVGLPLAETADALEGAGYGLA
ncbi:MAG: septum formation protein Maf [Alphaproteobacteria bacterium]|nr:septum formation protein Maf [Alphaproteobacteria bacterium]